MHRAFFLIGCVAMVAAAVTWAYNLFDLQLPHSAKEVLYYLNDLATISVVPLGEACAAATLIVLTRMHQFQTYEDAVKAAS